MLQYKPKHVKKPDSEAWFKCNPNGEEASKKNTNSRRNIKNKNNYEKNSNIRKKILQGLFGKSRFTRDLTEDEIMQTISLDNIRELG